MCSKVKNEFSFRLKNAENGTCQYYFAQEKKTIWCSDQNLWQRMKICLESRMCWLTLICSKRAQKDEPIQSGNSTKSQLSVFFAAQIREVLLGCNDAVLEEPLTKSHTGICLIYEEITSKPYNDNLCLFRALALHSDENEGLGEETSKCLGSSLRKL